MPPHALRLVRLLKWVATLLLAVLPLVVIQAVWRGAQAPGWLVTAFPGLPQGTVLSGTKSTLVLAVGALALGPMLAALWQMRGLFAHYAKGEVLTPASARRIRAIGLWLAVLAAIQILLPSVQRLVLTWDNPPGSREVSIALTSEMLWLALAAGLLVTIGWAMHEAARVAEENRGFV